MSYFLNMFLKTCVPKYKELSVNTNWSDNLVQEATSLFKKMFLINQSVKILFYWIPHPYKRQFDQSLTCKNWLRNTRDRAFKVKETVDQIGSMWIQQQ